MTPQTKIIKMIFTEKKRVAKKAASITRFERGSALIVTNSNNVTVDMRCSEEEKDLITTDRDELRRIVERKMQNQPETEES